MEAFVPPRISSWLGQSKDFLQQPSTITAIIALVVVTTIVTRTLTSLESTSLAQDGTSQQPPSPPYWLPILGHLPSLAVPSFLPSLRRKYQAQGLFSLNVFSRTHTVITKPAFASQLLLAGSHTADHEWLYAKISRNVFNYVEDLDVYRRVFYNAKDPPMYKDLMSEPGLSEITNETLRLLKTNIADLVTFNSYQVDQTVWERLAGAEVIKEGEALMEVDLMVLVKTFVAATSAPALWGSNFLENFPEVWDHLWAFDQHFSALLMGIPFWVPIPGVQRGRAARRKLEIMLAEYERALDKWADGADDDPKWQDLDNVSRHVKWRLKKYREEGMNIRGRAAMDLTLLWGANANSKPAIAWMLVECYRDAVLAEKIREEISPYVQIEEQENEFAPGIWLRPEVKKLDLDGLLNHCLLLKSLYVEVMRFYVLGSSSRWMERDLVLKDKDTKEPLYQLKRGTWAHVPQQLHQFNEEYFENPNEFIAGRHIVETVGKDGVKRPAVELGTIKPFGGGSATCKGRVLAPREIFMYTAMILATWDMKMPEGKRWGEIKTRQRVGGREPVEPLKVWIKRRKLPVAKS